MDQLVIIWDTLSFAHGRKWKGLTQFYINTVDHCYGLNKQTCTNDTILLFFFLSNSVAEFNSKPPEVRGSTQAVLHDNNDTACTTILIRGRSVARECISGTIPTRNVVLIWTIFDHLEWFPVESRANERALRVCLAPGTVSDPEQNRWNRSQTAHERIVSARNGSKRFAVFCLQTWNR